MSAEFSEADDQQDVLENIPENLRQLRACLTCRLIKTTRQWNQGCPNCLWDNTMTNTTPVFKGVLAMMQPETSWVARWQKQAQHKRPGLYAMQVVGKPPRRRDD